MLLGGFFRLIDGRLDGVLHNLAGVRILVDFVDTVSGGDVERVDSAPLLFFQFCALDRSTFLL